MVALLPDADHLHHQPKFGRKKCRTVLFTSLALAALGVAVADDR